MDTKFEGTDIQPGDLLKYHCTNARRLVIVAPYIKEDALSIILASLDPSASLICVTRWSLNDLVVGVSDVQCRAIVKEFGGSFRLHPFLHAKYYRIDDVVLVGSANLTSSAMGWSVQPNLEILCYASDEFDYDSFQRTLFQDAREVSDEEFRYWETVNHIATQDAGTSIDSQIHLRTWKPKTRDPRNLIFAYRDRVIEIASFDEQQAALDDLAVLSIPLNLSDREVHAWVSACLLSSPFVNSVIQLRSTAIDEPSYRRTLADQYMLSVTEARRLLESVESWLSFFIPGVIR